MSIRIVLADDHSILRDGISRSLEQEKDIEVVGQAADGLTAVQLVRKLKPDVIVMDIGMPELNGLEATRQITKEFPEVKVVGLSMHSGDKYVREMFKAGACGYVLKNCPFEELVMAIRTVANGNPYISPSISSMMIQEYVTKSENEKNVFSILSSREREVLQQLAEGKTTKQAGMTLHISPKTVEAHRLNIMSKLGFDNVPQLTKYAIQEGLTEPEP